MKCWIHLRSHSWRKRQLSVVDQCFISNCFPVLAFEKSSTIWKICIQTLCAYSNIKRDGLDSGWSYFASSKQNISHKKSGGCSGTKLDCLELVTLTPLKYTWCIFHKLLSIFCIFVHITVWAVLKTSILRQMHLEHLKKRSAVSFSQMHLPIISQFWSGAKVSRTRIMKWKICILHFVKRS